MNFSSLLPFAFCLSASPLSLHSSAVDKTCLYALLKLFTSFRIRKVKLDRNA